MAENGFQGELMVLIPTRSASEANKLRLSFGVKFLPRWRFGLVFIVVCLKSDKNKEEAILNAIGASSLAVGSGQANLLA